MQLTLDAAQSALRKDEGQAAIEATDQAFVETMREYARSISQQSGFVSMDNLRVIASELGLVPKHPNSWGSVFRGKRWTILGYQKSAIPSNHSRPIAIWKWEP